MATSTIKTMQRTLRHTAAANQTYAAQIAELKTVFDALTEAEKRNAILVDSSDEVFQLVSTKGVFSYTTAYSGGIYVYTFNLYTSKRFNAYANSSSTGSSDMTSGTNTVSVSLYA